MDEFRELFEQVVIDCNLFMVYRNWLAEHPIAFSVQQREKLTSNKYLSYFPQIGQRPIVLVDWNRK